MECQTDTCTLFMKHIIPGFGGLLALGIGLSPMKSVLQINKDKSLGTVNSLPFAFMVSNALSWILYGYLIHDWYVFSPNFFMYHLALYYCLSTYRYSPQNVQANIMTAILGSSALLFLGSAIGFLIFSKDNFDVAKNIMGTLCVVVLIIFYSSPLSNMVHVIKTKNAMSIDPLLSVTSICNASLWTVYGFVQKDIYIWGPNILGIFFTIIQLILIGIFGRRPEEHVLPNDNIGQNKPAY